MVKDKGKNNIRKDNTTERRSIFAFINNSISHFTYLFKKHLLISCHDHICIK